MDATLWHRLASLPPARLPQSPDRSAASGEELEEFLGALGNGLAGLVLPSERVDEIHAQLDVVISDNRHTPAGSKTIAALTAPYAAGKSTAITGWAYAKHRSWTADAPVDVVPVWEPEPGMTASLVPVVYLSLISSAGVKELNAQILTFLGYPGEGITRVTTGKVNLALRRHGVRALIVDDAHMLRLTNKTSRLVLDYLKSLNSELGFLNATMILVGADLKSTPILDDPQIRGRLHLLELTPTEIATVHGRREWQRFLKCAEGILLPYLPHCTPGALSQRHAGLLWKRTQGYFGDAARLMTGALLNALARHGKTITTEDILTVRLSQRADDAHHRLTAGARKSA